LTKTDKNTLTDCLKETLTEEFSIFFQDFAPDKEFMSEAEELAEKKYSSSEWNCNRKE
jgi:lipoate-protein ligase A